VAFYALVDRLDVGDFELHRRSGLRCCLLLLLLVVVEFTIDALVAVFRRCVILDAGSRRRVSERGIEWLLVG